MGLLFLKHPYVFSPLTLVGPVLRFPKVHQRPCTFVVLDVYPKKYLWPLFQSGASKSCRLAIKGVVGVLLSLSKQGWTPYQGIPGDLWAFAVHFPGESSMDNLGQ